jgi:hypothetical protein
MPPSRNAKRAAPPKNRGKTGGTTRTSSTNAHSLQNGVTSVHRVRATPTQAPPSRLAKQWSVSQLPPVHVTTDAVDSSHASSEGWGSQVAPAAVGRTTAEPTSIPQGFTYVSPEVLAAARVASGAHGAPSSSPLQRYQRQQVAAAPSSPSASPSYLFARQSSSAAESSLARLRALANSASTLALSPPSPSFLRNEESPLQPRRPSEASASTQPSTPTTPFTPDLARRLAELNGSSYTKTLSVLRVDRLKRARNAVAAAGSQPSSPPPLPSFDHHDEDEEEARYRVDHALLACGDTSVAASAAAATRRVAAREDPRVLFGRRSTDNEEEEEGVEGQAEERRCGGCGVDISAASHTTDAQHAFSQLTRLRAAGCVGSSPASVDVTSRLAFLRQRMTASPNSTALAPTTASSSFLTTRISPPTAPPEVAAAMPLTANATPSLFMNLERMRVGHGSNPAPSSVPTHGNNSDHAIEPTVPDLRGDSSSLSGAVYGGGGGGRSFLDVAPPYTLLAQANALLPVNGRSATPSSLPMPPTSIDARLHEAGELLSLESHLQRYRDAAAQSLLPPRPQSSPNSSSSNLGCTVSGGMGGLESTAAGAGPAAASMAKRIARRSQRRRTTAAAKKASAVVTLVRGRRSAAQRSSGGDSANSDSGTGSSTLSPAQMVARLRSLAVPVPVGEPSKPVASSLPPSWSSTSPFASLASPHLYSMLSSTAQQGQQASGTEKSSDSAHTASDAVAAAASSTSATSMLAYNYPSMTTPLPPSPRRLPAFSSCRTPRDRVLPASSQCIVFDTSSLLDSEPGVLNLLLERAYIGIPFKVLDELDHMHKGGGGGGTAIGAEGSSRLNSGAGTTHDREWRRKRAHDLRNWITACVGRANTHLLLQKRTEVVEAYDRRTATNDDQILGYAVYLRRHREKVLFVTEDKFLRIKAAAEIGRAYSYAEVRQLVGMPSAAPSSPCGGTVKRVVVRKTRRKALKVGK